MLTPVGRKLSGCCCIGWEEISIAPLQGGAALSWLGWRPEDFLVISHECGLCKKRLSACGSIFLGPEGLVLLSQAPCYSSPPISSISKLFSAQDIGKFSFIYRNFSKSIVYTRNTFPSPWGQTLDSQQVEFYFCILLWVLFFFPLSMKY